MWEALAWIVFLSLLGAIMVPAALYALRWLKLFP